MLFEIEYEQNLYYYNLSSTKYLKYTLLELKQDISAFLELTIPDYKLFHQGIELTSLKSPLFKYSLTKTPKLLIINNETMGSYFSKLGNFLFSTTKRLPSKEEQLIEAIDQCLDKAAKDTDQLFESFKEATSAEKLQQTKSEQEKEDLLKSLKDQHHKLSELLLSRLIELDGVIVEDPELTDVKDKRKQAVKHIQQKLTKIDKIFEEINPKLETAT